MTLTAGSLFSGIGAMDYAVAAAGFSIRWQIEKDPFCQRVLTHHKPHYWPEAELHGDAKEVRGTQLHPVDLVFGGPPCQPYSNAGRRRGAADDRHLWPEMLRLIQELDPRPRFVLIENVANLINVFLSTLLSDLEGAGYTPLPPLVIPAAAQGAPHKRDRVWVMAYANPLGRQEAASTEFRSTASDSQQYLEIRQPEGRTVLPPPQSGRQTLADSDSIRQLQPSRSILHLRRRTGDSRQGLGNPDGTRSSQRQGLRQRLRTQLTGTERASHTGGWRKFFESPLGTHPDGFAARLVGHPWPAPQGAEQFDWEPPRTAPSSAIPERAAKVAAIGNAVVPQAVYPIAVSIYQWLSNLEEKIT